jgi:LemA protein
LRKSDYDPPGVRLRVGRDNAHEESALLIGLKQLFAVAEGYPELKADVQFLALQKELANTEDRIAAARRFFNGNVREMNVLLAAFPTNLIGRRFNFEAGSYFELVSNAERVLPTVGLRSPS